MRSSSTVLIAILDLPDKSNFRNKYPSKPAFAKNGDGTIAFSFLLAGHRWRTKFNNQIKQIDKLETQKKLSKAQKQIDEFIDKKVKEMASDSLLDEFQKNKFWG